MVQTAAKLIDDLGGPMRVGEALKERPATVRMWKLRNRVPRTKWPDLIDAFPELTLDRLKGTELAA